VSRSRRETRRLAVGWVCAGGRRLQAAGLNPFRFSTKRTDPTTDLVLYEYRAYSATLGRWLSRDRFGEVSLLNLFGFGPNAPVGGLDLLGLHWTDWRLADFVECMAIASRRTTL